MEKQLLACKVILQIFKFDIHHYPHLKVFVIDNDIFLSITLPLLSSKWHIILYSLHKFGIKLTMIKVVVKNFRLDQSFLTMEFLTDFLSFSVLTEENKLQKLLQRWPRQRKTESL